MLRPLVTLLLALAAVPLAACGDTEPLVVVQETNMPDSPAACDRAFVHRASITRTCSGMQATVMVCADEEVCDAALETLQGQVATCAPAPYQVDLSICP